MKTLEKVNVSGHPVYGSGVQGSGFRVQDSGVQGSEFRSQGVEDFDLGFGMADFGLV